MSISSIVLLYTIIAAIWLIGKIYIYFYKLKNEVNRLSIEKEILETKLKTAEVIRDTYNIEKENNRILKAKLDYYRMLAKGKPFKIIINADDPASMN